MHPCPCICASACHNQAPADPAGGSGALVCEAAAADHTLSATDQHLVLGSAAFWQLVGPADAALRAHFHEKVQGGRCGIA